MKPDDQGTEISVDYPKNPPPLANITKNSFIVG
jgi:hypothetical protein